MSNIQSRVYEDAVDVTKSDTVNDPAGPFAALLVSVAGTLKITTSRNNTVALTVIAGQEVRILTKRVWSTGSSSTVTGLLALPYKGKPTPNSGS